jgi:uncharacterized protein (DUF1501 family)
MANYNRDIGRRAILTASLGAAAMAGTGFGFTLNTLMAASAQTTGDYKALVCVFFFGGNDNSNTVIPATGAEHNSYATARGGLALAQSELSALSPTGYSGPPLALNPAMTNMRSLFAAGEAAMVANVGTLAHPMTLAQYQNRSVARPFQLFSHSDQQTSWQTGIPDGNARHGWLGRIADIIGPTFNPNQLISPSISVAGNSVLMAGQTTLQYQMSTSGPLAIGQLTSTSGFNNSLEAQAWYRQMLTRPRAGLMEDQYRSTVDRAIRVQRDASAALSDVPAFTTAFPNTTLGRQLQMAARCIGARGGLNQSRQMFFTSIGGWDFHDNLLVNQASKLTEVDQAIGAFQAAMAQLGLKDRVTLFTASDFGRGLQSNGRGSDHGWGAHHFVVGGAVRGNRVFGAWPDVVLRGANDVGQGRLLPSTSVDQYAATLGKWFGLSAFELGTVLPNLNRFSNQDLGFLG